MNKLKKWANEFFIEGLSGMASGLFATLIIGTIIKQIGSLCGGTFGNYLVMIGSVASAVTGAGIGTGVAIKLKQKPLVIVSAASAGMMGAFASKLLAGTVVSGSVLTFAGPGEPLGAFLAAYTAILLGRLVAGKTKVDILVTPMVSILTGSAVGLVLGPPISSFMTGLGGVINWGTEQQPFFMGIIVSVLMGMILTAPISSAAIGISLELSGIAAGAATIGCCANMVGFAVISFRENRFSGLLAQGLGTSMLQVPNIVKKPVVWLPAIFTSAILGPVSTMLFHMKSNAVGSGMGSSGLVGQIMTFQTMTTEGQSPLYVLFQILLMHFILPALLSLLIAEGMRKLSLIKAGDMKLPE